MEKFFELEIVTPNEVFFKGKVVSLNCVTTEGRYGVLPDHCAAIAGLVEEVTKFEDTEGKTYNINTGKGILKIRKNNVTMLCDSAEWVK